MVSPALPATWAPGSAARALLPSRTCAVPAGKARTPSAVPPSTTGPPGSASAEWSWQPRDHARASAPKHLLSSEKHPSPFPLLSTTTQVAASACSPSFPTRCCSGPGLLALPCSYSEIGISQEEKLARTLLSSSVPFALL